MNQVLRFKAKTLSIIFSAIICSITIACVKDNMSLTDPQQGDKVIFKLNIPTNIQVVTKATTEASSAELEIRNGYCLIYSNNNPSSEPKMTYTFNTAKDILEGGNGTINPTISIPKKIDIESTDIVVFIFNTEFSGNGSFGNRLDDIKYSQIKTSFPLNGNGGFETTTGAGIPMYGQFTGFSGSGTQTINIYRSVAKIQIKLKSPMTGSATDISNFTTTNIKYQIFNLAIAGNVNHVDGFDNTTILALNSNDQNEAPKTSITGQNINKETSISSSNDNYIGASYIYEYHYSDNIIGENNSTNIAVNTPNKNRLAIILQNSNNNKYYRLDLSHIGPEYLDVIRNHHYQIVINEVNSDGYANIDDALNGSASNIIYEIIDNSGTTTISNGRYAISVGAELYANNTITTQGTAPITIANDLRYITPVGLSLPAGLTNSVICIDATSKSQIPSNIITVSPNTLSDIATQLSFTFLDQNYSGETAFKITLGNLSYESEPITIKSGAIGGVVINIGTTENPIWIEVADRNAAVGGINGGTAGNSSTDYGSYYYWSNSTYYTSDADKSYMACYNFGEGNGSWRMPTGNEMKILSGNSGYATDDNLQRKLQHDNNIWKLHDERPGQEGNFVYFPLSGHLHNEETGKIENQGYYWSSNGSGGGNVEVLVIGDGSYTHITNYNVNTNNVGFPVRCVRNVVDEMYGVGVNVGATSDLRWILVADRNALKGGTNGAAESNSPTDYGY